MSSGSSSDDSMPGSLPDNISNMGRGQSVSSGHSGGIRLRATHVNFPPDMPISRALSPTLSIPVVAPPQVDHVARTAQGSALDQVSPYRRPPCAVDGGSLAVRLASSVTGRPYTLP